MTRRDARALALQTLFSVEVGHHDAGDVLAETLAQPGNAAEAGFVEDIVRGTIEHAS